MASRAMGAEGVLRPYHMLVGVVLGLGMVSNGLLLSLLSVALAGARETWQLQPSEAMLLPFFSALGQGAGALLFGNLADRFGRRRLYALALTIMGVSTALASLASSLGALVALQSIAGIGFGGITPVAGSLMAELLPASHRGRFTALTQVFWVSGWAVGAVAGWALAPALGWRSVLWLGLLGLLLVPVVLRTVPESPRFLLARGNRSEAEALVAEIKARHDVELELPEQRTATPGLLAGLRELWTPPYRRRTIAIWVTWLTMFYAHSGLIVWLPTLIAAAGGGTAEGLRLSLGVAVSQLPAAVLGVALIDRVGRRWLIIAGLAVALVGAAGMVWSPSPEGIAVAAMPVAAGLIVAWAVILAYASELYPTRVRASGAGWASTVGRVGAVSAPLALGLLLTSWSQQRQALATFAGALALGLAVMVFLAEETAGRSLEDLAE